MAAKAFEAPATKILNDSGAACKCSSFRDGRAPRFTVNVFGSCTSAALEMSFRVAMLCLLQGAGHPLAFCAPPQTRGGLSRSGDAMMTGASVVGTACSCLSQSSFR